MGLPVLNQAWRAVGRVLVQALRQYKHFSPFVCGKDGCALHEQQALLRYFTKDC